MMVLNSINEATDHQVSQPKTASAVKKTVQFIKADTVEAASKVTEAVKTPASEATFAAAAQAEGMKKIELEIAAAAGLLRPISHYNTTTSKRSGHDIGTLIKTVENLEQPEKPHNLDLFE